MLKVIKVQRTIQVPQDLDRQQIAYRDKRGLSFNAFVLDLIRKAVGGKKS